MFNIRVSMRIFITGTTGFLGQQLSNLLIKKGHKIGTLARNVAKSDRAIASNTESMIEGEKHKGISYYFGDLTDYLNIQDVLTNFKPDVIIHLAAQTSVAYSFTHTTEIFNVNFLGVVNMAEAARRVLPKLKRFIFSGSVEEYGIQTKFPTKETAELMAASPYGVAKIAAEKTSQISISGLWIPGNYIQERKLVWKKIQPPICNRKHDLSNVSGEIPSQIR